MGGDATCVKAVEVRPDLRNHRAVLRDPVLVDRARALRLNMSEAEKNLWFRLRSRKVAGYRFRRQVPIGGYIADFVCLSARLIIEVDGRPHSKQGGHFLDEKRTEW